MKQVTVIVIEWEEIPFSESELNKHCNKWDCGLYQVYGHHPAYGPNSLLYIGKTEELFAKRLSKRWEFVESSVRPKYICLGRIVQSPKVEELEWEISNWGKMINIAEQMLIKTHNPSLNKQHIGGLFNNAFEGVHYLVINTGDYGQMLPEVSSLRMSYTYWNFETPIGKVVSEGIVGNVSN